MNRLLTTREVTLLEQRAVAEAGLSLFGLMTDAGTALAQVTAERVPEGEIVVLCGSGNNGGDGWIAARELHVAGRSVRVFALKAPAGLSGQAAEAAASALSAGVEWIVPSETITSADLAGAQGVVDALLGTGARLPLAEPLTGWCEAVNTCGAFVVSADIPTGIDGDNGAAHEDAVFADCTVTFIAPKRGLVMQPGATHAGQVVVADLGLPAALRDVEGAPEIWSAQEYARCLPGIAPDAHKNDRGRILIVAGSGRYPGAAVLAARGAMRAGAGYVTLAVPDPVVHIAQAHLLAVPVVGLPSGRHKALSSNALATVLDLARDHDAVVIGPGLTLFDGAVSTARGVVSALEAPLVIDADGLNALVDAQELITARRAPTVLTPHPGELARLLGETAGAVQSDRVSSSARLASGSCSVVLKGAGTVTSSGGRAVVNTSGTAALATAGTGDVLAGVVGALLAQGLDSLSAGALGAYLHGRAGEIAAADLTPYCVTSEDLPEYLPAAFGELLEVW